MIFRILGLLTFSVIITSNLHCQNQYQLLIENEYPLELDTAVTNACIWYGFYQRDSVESSDYFKKVELKLIPKTRALTGNKYFYSVKGESKKSLFLLGIKKSDTLKFEDRRTCGLYKKYGKAYGVLHPGAQINSGLATMSCSNLSIYATGLVEANKGYVNISNYRLFAHLDNGIMDSNRTQELTLDIIDPKENVSSYFLGMSIPVVYAVGDFNQDSYTDFIIYYGGRYYLYFTNENAGDDIVDLVASVKLRKYEFEKGHD